jgi:hypothetical protein
MQKASLPIRSRSMLWPLVAGTASSCRLLPGAAGPAAARAARSFTIACTSTVTAAAAHVSLSRRPARNTQRVVPGHLPGKTQMRV